MSEAGDCWAVVVAAGSGSRMGDGVPKQFRPLAGRSLLAWSLQALRASTRIAGIAVVLPADASLDDAGIEDSKGLIRVDGGAERMDSVAAGLAALRTAGADEQAHVLVHDGARPCLPSEALTRLLSEADGPDGGLLALPMSDTVKRANGDVVADTLDRAALWRAQTPQCFPLGVLATAIESARAAGAVCSDEAQAMERAGYHPRLVRGDARNIKLTTPDDWPLAAWLLERA
ncbi:2-C-methyl-D-erythritol 4-phosphate cytidylyltransferase [Algiphilus aromaticivorans]|uniref:2-C-methyl-D-erythritol 4-phosphate cytidylyltransferase n=1 Tax=Algiphilus aromaticivorans TaxID=382454 RepID=UPI0005C20129|nr:2-C-methyl-D-erythritol 4-phosphate cytidylyltransferase [Algiphilus aromaticivorans]